MYRNSKYGYGAQKCSGEYHPTNNICGKYKYTTILSIFIKLSRDTIL